MTTPIKTGKENASSTCGENDVEAYLRSHPEFFVDNPDLLTELEVPHPAGGAVSLIERQVALIRQENKQHRERIRELVEIARSNESIVNKLHQLTIQLVTSSTVQEYSNKIKQLLCDDFLSNHVSLVLFKENMFDETGDAILVSRSDSAVLSFEGILQNGHAVCGQFSKSQRYFLFGDSALEVKSMALIPLNDGDNMLGMLAIGNADIAHFKADMSTSLLASLGDVSSAVLKRIAKN